MRVNKAELKAKIKFKVISFIAMLPYHFLVMGSVAIFAFMLQKWVESVLFLTAFFALRYKFPTTFHAKSLLYCMILTNSLFVASIILCPLAETYLFGALIFAFIDTFVLFYVQQKDEFRQDKECAEAYAKELEQKLKDCQNPHSEFLKKCRKAKLSKRDTEIAFKYFIEGQKPREIWNWLCECDEYDYIEWDSVYRIISRISIKLNSQK